jgi:hypothetical protein
MRNQNTGSRNDPASLQPIAAYRQMYPHLANAKLRARRSKSQRIWLNWPQKQFQPIPSEPLQANYELAKYPNVALCP